MKLAVVLLVLAALAVGIFRLPTVRAYEVRSSENPAIQHVQVWGYWPTTWDSFLEREPKVVWELPVLRLTENFVCNPTPARFRAWRALVAEDGLPPTTASYIRYMESHGLQPEITLEEK